MIMNRTPKYILKSDQLKLLTNKHSGIIKELHIYNGIIQAIVHDSTDLKLLEYIKYNLFEDLSIYINDYNKERNFFDLKVHYLDDVEIKSNEAILSNDTFFLIRFYKGFSFIKANSEEQAKLKNKLDMEIVGIYLNKNIYYESSYKNFIKPSIKNPKKPDVSTLSEKQITKYLNKYENDLIEYDEERTFLRKYAIKLHNKLLKANNEYREKYNINGMGDLINA